MSKCKLSNTSNSLEIQQLSSNVSSIKTIALISVKNATILSARNAEKTTKSMEKIHPIVFLVTK